MENSFADEFIFDLIKNQLKMYMDVYKAVEAINENVKVGLYPAGEHTEKLLALTSIKRKNICHIFDSKKRNIGGYLVTVPSKENVNECQLIVVSSRTYAAELIKELRDTYDYKGKVLYFYSNGENRSFYEYHPFYCNGSIRNATRHSRLQIDVREADILRESYLLYSQIENIGKDARVCAVGFSTDELYILIELFGINIFQLSICDKINSSEALNYDKVISKYDYEGGLNLNRFFLLYKEIKKNAFIERRRWKMLVENFCYSIERSSDFSINYKVFNKYHKDFIRQCENETVYSDTAIVIQGPIRWTYNYTKETILQYKNLFPEARIILSTWSGEEKNRRFDEIDDIDGLDIVLGEKPSNPGFYNINLQTTSSYNGIEYARKLHGVKYVLKTRTDERIYSEGALDMMRTIVRNSERDSGKRKIVCSATEALKYIRYYYADHYNFGHIDDMMIFWSPVEFDNPSSKDKTSPEVWPESALYYRYVRSIAKNVEVKDDLLFAVIPVQLLDLEWNKYEYTISFDNRSKAFFGVDTLHILDEGVDPC